jgi:hypothetical protein
MQPCALPGGKPYEGPGAPLPGAPHAAVRMHAHKGLSLGSEFGLRAFIESAGNDIDDAMCRAMASLEIT